MCDNKRPFVTRGKKYYATIMLHSFAPASSMNAFFGLCYNLFKNDLDFGDADAEFCHRVAVALRSKLGGSLGESSGVAIGSQVYGFKIGLRALILQGELSEEFESVCKEIFSYICRRYERKEVSCETRLVNLLDKWWESKSVDDSQKRGKHSEPPVLKRNIQLKYVYEMVRHVLGSRRFMRTATVIFVIEQRYLSDRRTSRPGRLIFRCVTEN